MVVCAVMVEMSAASDEGNGSQGDGGKGTYALEVCAVPQKVREGGGDGGEGGGGSGAGFLQNLVLL